MRFPEGDTTHGQASKDGFDMANRVRVGWIWEAVEGEPSHFYEILSDDEIVQLRRLSDRKITTRFKGQVIKYGLVRRKRRDE